MIKIFNKFKTTLLMLIILKQKPSDALFSIKKYRILNYYFHIKQKISFLINNNSSF